MFERIHEQSYNLRALERTLGTRLLHRTSRTVAPTTAGVRVLARARVLLAGADELVREAAAATPDCTSAMPGPPSAATPRSSSAVGATGTPRSRSGSSGNSPTGGLAEGLRDLAVIRAPLDLAPWSHALVGHEQRCVALASDDPWARRRSVRLAEITDGTLALDRRTGTTTLDLWPAEERPATEHTHDIDDWLAAIATGRCVGVTPRATAAQYRRDGITYRPLCDAAPIPVHLIWRRHDPHPSTHAAVALALDLYCEGTPAARGGQGTRR